MKKIKDDKEEFMRKNYTTCKYCEYNNEKSRLQKYGTCLKCGRVLDDRIYFKIQAMKILNENKRKSR